MTKRTSRLVPFSGFVIPSTFACRAVAPRRRVIRLPRRSPAKAGHSSFRARGAFTILELLVVITLIIALAGLILATVGYVQKKGARSRAEAETAAISAALESYKADNGAYPRDTVTDSLDARAAVSLPTYQTASLYLYKQLTGDSSANRQPPAGTKAYIAFKPNQLGPIDQTQPVQFIRDPFGNSYGYSTAYQADVDAGAIPPARGYNPTFDLWSTGGSTTGTDQSQWIKNW